MTINEFTNPGKGNTYYGGSPSKRGSGTPIDRASFTSMGLLPELVWLALEWWDRRKWRKVQGI